ncbi:unnamed protein product [Polarella glacialis]|uniref:Uncharacterized protein n=1 Tax=Polarella glacialis TaxID=89957 RepID=A0A813DGX5_POLGL|nr:unnamed protein product [Polarella glacialis]CAE8654557.1 unnamed protein product [Polarella glacialis]CAE8743511.1 unnamed protein product [Polarella glacialis]
MGCAPSVVHRVASPKNEFARVVPHTPPAQVDEGGAFNAEPRILVQSELPVFRDEGFLPNDSVSFVSFCVFHDEVDHMTDHTLPPCLGSHCEHIQNLDTILKVMKEFPHELCEMVVSRSILARARGSEARGHVTWLSGLLLFLLLLLLLVVVVVVLLLFCCCCCCCFLLLLLFVVVAGISGCGMLSQDR